jgi:hypothetical protein
MRRVKKEEVTFQTWVKPDGYALCMECWKAYMSTDDRDLSASRMQLRGGEEDPVAYESDPYGDQRRADIKMGESVDAMIDSLKPVESWAVRKKYGVMNVWNFPQADYVAVLLRAEDKLKEMLQKNIATAVMF